MEAKHSSLLFGPCHERVEDADSEVEAVEDHKNGQHHGHRDIPERLHVAMCVSTLTMRSPLVGRPTGTGPFVIVSSIRKRNRSPNNRYIPRKPSKVNRALPECTSGEMPLGGPQQAIHKPGLAAELSRHPPCRRRDIGKRRGEDEPQQPPRAEQPTAPEEQERQSHHGSQNRSQPCHDVIRVVEQRHVVRPSPREGIEALHLGVQFFVHEKAEPAWQHQRVINRQRVHIRLADHQQAAARSVRNNPSNAAPFMG